MTFTYTSGTDWLRNTQNAVSSVNYKYDSLGRIINRNMIDIASGKQFVVEYDFKPLDYALEKLTYWDDKVVTIGTNALQQVTSLKDFDGRDITFHYNATNGLDGWRTPGGVYHDLQYDSAQRLDRIEVTKDGASRFDWRITGRDDNGNITNITEYFPTSRRTRTHEYGYDSQNRLTSMSYPRSEYGSTANTSNAYDSHGNATTFMGRSMPVNQKDQLDKNRTGVEYDTQGNTTKGQ